MTSPIHLPSEPPTVKVLSLAGEFMRIDANLMSPSVAEAGDLAQSAEKMGFDGGWVTELSHSPYTLMTQVADATTSIDVGTAIALAFPRSPTVTAYTAWDLQTLAEGRFVLGLGTQVKGHIERRFGMDWQAPGPWLREYVLALREMWNAWTEGRAPEFEGDRYRITLCPPEFVPDPPDNPHIPIYIAGVNEYNLRLAGELCEGLHVHPFHSPTYVAEQVLPHVRDGADRADRDPNEVTLATSVMAVAGDTPDEREAAREEVRKELAFYASTRTYRTVMEVHGWGETCDELHDLSVNDEWERMPELVTDEMVDTFSVEGCWDELREKIEDRYEHIDRVAVYTPFDGADYWRQMIDVH